MDDQDDVFDPELDDELEQNWYRLARRTQQLERKMFVALLDGEPHRDSEFQEDVVVADRHSAYNVPGSAEDTDHGVRASYGLLARPRRFEGDRAEALIWAIRAFRTRERVAFGTRMPIVHFCALWPADAAFRWDVSRPTPPGARYGEAMDDVRSELRWMEPGSIATFVVTQTYLQGLTAARLSPALWCITIPIPDHPVDPALVEALVRSGQWRGTEMARLDLKGGPAGSLQLLYRHHEIDEIADLIMLGARLIRGDEPDEYLVDVMIDERELPSPGETADASPAATPAILQKPGSGTGEPADQSSATLTWRTNIAHRNALHRDPSIDPRWHGFGDHLAQAISGLEESFGGGRWGTLAMTCYSAMHGYDGDASPQVRITATDGGWYCEVRDGTADESRPRSAGLGIVPRGWGRGFAIAGDIHPDAHGDDTWEHGRVFPAATSPFEVVHELLHVLTQGHGVLTDDFFAVDGATNWFAEAPGMQPLAGSWIFRLADARGPVTRDSLPLAVTPSPDPGDLRRESAQPLTQVYEMQVDDSETSVFRCRADSAEQAIAIALDAGLHDPLLLAHRPIPVEEQTDRARAAAEHDPLLGPSWMPLIDVLASELDKIEIHRPRTIQSYARVFRFDPNVSPYFQFLRQADGTMLAEVHGPWAGTVGSAPHWEDRVRMLGWRLRGDEESPSSEPLLREQADSPNPTKRFGAERSGYSIVSNVLSMVLFTWEITADDLFALPGHPEVFDASPHLERVNNKSIFRILPPVER